MTDRRAFPHIERLSHFMSAGTDYAAARAVLFGVPMDFTTSYRPGARFGPAGIRNASYGIEEFSYYRQASLADRAFYDLGDVAAVFGDAAVTLERTLATTRQLLTDGKLPILLGGEHLCTAAAFAAAAAAYGPNLALVQFDAHADLRDDYLGNRLSHASAMRRCLEHIAPGNLFQFGIRSGTAAEYEFGRDRCRLFPMAVLEPLRKVLPELAGRPVYVTIDIDVVDPAFAPGTGTPEPAGITSGELLAAIGCMSELNVIGFDVVEVAPSLDHSDRTALLAALIVREGLLAWT